MKCQTQRGISCLPVTALHHIRHKNVTYLLANEGSSLCIRGVEDDSVLLIQPIFASQNIHGITSQSCQYDGRDIRHQLIIWGGCRAWTGRLVIDDNVSPDDPARLYLEPGCSLSLVDWILHITFDQQTLDAVVLTACNELWQLETTSEGSTRPLLLGQGIKTLCYSGKLSTTDGLILVASGTIFGEVIVWTCSKALHSNSYIVTTKHFFIGHRGSVFGVAILEGFVLAQRQVSLVASCSDDRTIRIWDISDIDDDSITNNDVIQGTGFQEVKSQEMQLTMAWGHTSRIWDIQFLITSAAPKPTVRLFSRGEDGACHFWELFLEFVSSASNTIVAKISAIGNDRHHSGKNVWSMTSLDPITNSIYSGGADGQIVSHQTPWSTNIAHFSQRMKEIVGPFSNTAKCVLKHYLIFRDGIIIASTDAGDVLRVDIKDPFNVTQVAESLGNGSVVLCRSPAEHFALYIRADGQLCVYDTFTSTTIKCYLHQKTQISELMLAFSGKDATKLYTIYLVAGCRDNSNPCIIKLVQEYGRFLTTVITINVPTDFQITSALWSPHHNSLIIGSRAGAIAIMKHSDVHTEHFEPFTILRHIHGSDSVTAIKLLPCDYEKDITKSSYIITTGRDGTFAVHRLTGDQTNVALQTVHRATPPFGPNIEGVDVCRSAAGHWTVRLYGFKSKDFVVWDEINQDLLLSVECGGVHRSWSYASDYQDTDMLVWTKAGSWNYIFQNRSNHQVLQCGSHGREIKALAISPPKTSTENPQVHELGLIATGAEDTDIRIFRKSVGRLEQLAVLKHHTTGLQALQFSKCKKYLFSSGGIEEFAIWSITSISILHLGVTIVGTMPKAQDDNDARVMSFDVVDQTLDDVNSVSFLILMAYSNGKAKLWEFVHHHQSGLGHFVLKEIIHVGTLCLTQARIVRQNSSLFAMLGATDGLLRVIDVYSEAMSTVSCRVHQSNIATLKTSRLTNEHLLIVTGGDDNALVCTVMMTQDRGHKSVSAVVPNAHAAALTAVTVVDCEDVIGQDSVLLVSAGNDQKIKLWQLSGLISGTPPVSSDKDRPLQLHFEKLRETSIDVADISNIEMIGEVITSSGTISFEVLVVGVGMQSVVFKLDWE